MNNKGNLTDERPPLLPVIIGTGFGSGFWPWGPGTAGSVLATLIWAALAYGLGITGESLQSITFFLVIVSTILGTWATAQLQPYWGEDPSRVVIETPPAAVLLKKAAGIESASGEPNKRKVATITLEQAQEIAKTKMPDLNAASLEAATDMIKGTARSMGIIVEG